MDLASSAEIVLQIDTAENVVRMHSNRHIQPSVLRTMYDRKILFDVTLYGAPPTGDLVTGLLPIRAHKSVLASASKYFYDLFTCRGYLDSHSNEYNLPAIYHGSLQRIVEFIYTDEIKMTLENAVNVTCGIFVGADYLAIENLAAACEKFLAGDQRVNPENCVELWCLAQKLNCFTLMHATSTAIATNLANMPKDAEFMRMDHNDVSKLLVSEALVKADPDRVCRAAIAWLEFDGVGREPFVGDIVDVIPLKFGSVSYETACEADKCEILQKHAPETTRELTAAWQKKTKFVQSVAVSSCGESSKNFWYVMGGENTPRLFCKYDVARGYWSTLPPLPWDRDYFGACAVGNQLIALGGRKDGRASRAIDKYDLLGTTWSTSSSQIKRYTFETKRYMSVLTDGDQVYALDDDLPHNIQVYDPFSDNITVKIADGERCSGAGVIKVDLGANINCIYTAGGRYKHGDSIEKFDLSNNKWSTVGRLITGPRMDLATTLAGDDLYLMGGRLPSPLGFAKSVDIFNIRTGQIRAAPDLLHASCGFQATTVYNDNVVCALAGRTCDDRQLCSVETYDVREGRWSTGTIIPDMPTPAIEFGFAAAAI